jgi:hypothetical protein
MIIKTIAMSATKNQETVTLYADLNENDNINQCYLDLKLLSFVLLNKTPYKENDGNPSIERPNFR